MSTMTDTARHATPPQRSTEERSGAPARALVAAAPILAITLVGAVLRFWEFSRVGGNPFYDAAVRSMGQSWHNFFFGAFEPGGQVSVDKPPVDLWLQVLSVKLFGFSGTAVRLPEALAGVAAIPLLYDLVRRVFGRTSGLISAAALAVLPTAILTAHSDTMDSLMMLINVFAVWLVVRGAQRRSPWPIVAAGAALGLAFNVKLFEALIVAPPLALLILYAAGELPRRRLATVAGSAAAFVVVSLSWIVTASMTALSGRPYPLGSKDGSLWSLVFGYNGIDRIRGHASKAAMAVDPPGALRFFENSARHYADRVGTMIIAALVIGGIATVVALRQRTTSLRGRPSLATAMAVFFGIWLLLGLLLFSQMQRLQPRYLEAMTPAIAAVLGIGTGTLLAHARRQAGAAWLLVLAAGLSALLAVLIASPPGWAVFLAAAAVLGCALAAAEMLPRTPLALAACACVALLAIPASAAIKVAQKHQSNAGLPSSFSRTELGRLSSFLTAGQGQARYEFASPTVMRPAPVIVKDGRPVLMLANIDGKPLVSVAELQRAVSSGEVKYALLGRGSCPAKAKGPCAPAVIWARSHARDVGPAAGLPAGMLYELSANGRPAAP